MPDRMPEECQIRMLDRIVRVFYKYVCQYISKYLPWRGSLEEKYFLFSHDGFFVIERNVLLLNVKVCVI